MPRLPEFVEPMLARGGGEPFDSDEYTFEIKWDGFRALAFVESGRLRLTSRRGVRLDRRFEELAALGGLPDGTVLDGEIVQLDDDGRPDFEGLLAHDSGTAPPGRAGSATFVAFDLLFDRFEDVTARPLSARRERAEALAAQLGSPHVAFSASIAGAGRTFAAQTFDRGLEGVVAKRLDSPYRPGQRTDDWIKVKRRERRHCLILGWVPRGRDLRSLVLASDFDGELRPVGRVGSGIDGATRDRLLELLRGRPRSTPLLPCDEPGALWVEPGLYCTVRCHELTAAGRLRAPVFETLLVEGG